MSPEAFVACFLVTTLAAVVHGSAGMGFALIAAPVLLLIDASLIPGPLLAAGLTLTVLMAVREWEAADLRGVGWALAGCAAGCGMAIPVIRLLSPIGFAILFATLLLLAVGLSAAGFEVSPARGTNMVGGFASGFMGTISSVGGPPMALVYQRTPGATIRSTLAVYFSFAGVFSLAALYVAGRMGSDEIVLAGYLCPGLLAGYGLSSYTRRFLDRRMLRPMVLLLATAAALAVVVKAVL